ncbi:bifunctional diaminohydroxyphosphoribosylaminopyrimidine deaminase/5-amino-6-(5-phosphoribosylamino)uracil reductase RibD [uncultured Nitratireductor sp.]|uniref:bifunctional diaminohydroxyphosphoribosylaminopyrimidine deaminase/5-amino-6-(5-phosphoribosylamino)uracil reductase RibD n=1 Tax=uncultured Nitratireductor sp. TaxID=520953 RepID=UPI0025E625D3|nr:bifunctional diaminohydroxyphosphoribosylaminopyrimidine deaminase/5-amino-6-(5-phosphoribosylamino)uracil reductase RibD [uncultured Nitratireductor sp.]
MDGGLASELDRRFMAAATRLSRRNLGLTGTNPSVGTLIVRDGRIVGSGVTAIGGRPHAEPQALAEAGAAARGATAYVTLEPCAHHGRTPPCANALVSSGITRVVGAAADPDPRVSGKGYAILREAGIEVVEGVLAEEAADMLRGYLTRSLNKRPEVTLKLALSADGMIGRIGEGQVAITGPVSRRQVHMMRAESDAILVGIGTALADDPLLTCRLPGLEGRSPLRVVLDRGMKLPVQSVLAQSARDVPVLVTAAEDCRPERRKALSEAGVDFLGVELHDGEIALPEFLEDLAARGVLSLMVEGGAFTARMFLEEGLVDRLALFIGPSEIGAGGIAAPIDSDHIPEGFDLLREARFGDDVYLEYVKGGLCSPALSLT